MTVSIPSSKRRSIWKSNRLPSVLTGVGAIAGAGVTVWQRYAADVGQTLAPLKALLPNATGTSATAASAALQKLADDVGRTWPALLAFLWVLVVSIITYIIAHHKDIEANEEGSPAVRLLGPLIFLEELMQQKKGLAPGDKRFRATLHRVGKDEHEQCLPYVGFKGGDLTKVGRTWSNHCGLVGQLARAREHGHDSEEPLVASMNEKVVDQDTYIAALIKLYSYTYEQARNHEPMRLSQMAIPITPGDSQAVIGVVYCDSSERGFFDDEETKKLCVTCGMAIASLVRNNH